MSIRRSRFTESQIVAFLKEGDAGVPIAGIFKNQGISRPTSCFWRSKYARASLLEIRRLRELEQEAAKLKRIYVELALSAEGCDATRETAVDRDPARRARSPAAARG